jgi:cytochrome c5
MKLSHGLGMAVGILACFVVGCGDGAPAEPSTEPAQTSAPSTPKAAGPAPLTAQAIEGQKLFEAHCTKCHGDSVGLSAFGTAADVVDYVSENMPRDAPGSLTQGEYFSFVAFDLTAKGVDLHGETLDATNAASLSVR